MNDTPTAEQAPAPSATQAIVDAAVRYAEEQPRRCILRGVILQLEFVEDRLEAEHCILPAGSFPLRAAPEAERTAQVVPAPVVGVGAASAETPREGPAQPRPPRQLCRMEERILAALAVAERPLKQVLLARRMGLERPTSHMKDCCSRLRGDGLVCYVPGQGFWRADRTVPGAA